MEKTERETHDFMNVESFSQLPFNRPLPGKEKGIKLFGIEFGAHSAPPGASCKAEQMNMETNSGEEAKHNSNIENGESGRRFECHYCCRNFPTSQALGGHQNAHKRERQHAKRIHLQSAMVHGSLSDAHVYGLMNYRIGSATSSPAPMTYPTWNTTTNPNSRFYGAQSSSHQQQLVNGSPLALWQIPSNIRSNPSLTRDHSTLHPRSLFAGEDLRKPSRVSSNYTDDPSQGRYVYDDAKASMQEHVSLDLHL
ncbi:hypothetical protein SAY86_030429 [Trapa natans]|uniref:C2H2-type domain-containing protein n=1 Tax=Trapa natans TaxID=22666 RepID=A0AAN7LXY1_TRANT|nr:hypothetical protein SAY86_030429 [Trapa natans]